MKTHLVMAAAFAALCSHAAFAASEGGDTWSELQPQSVARSTRSLAIATAASSPSPRSASIPASEAATPGRRSNRIRCRFGPAARDRKQRANDQPAGLSGSRQ